MEPSPRSTNGVVLAVGPHLSESTNTNTFRRKSSVVSFNDTLLFHR